MVRDRVRSRVRSWVRSGVKVKVKVRVRVRAGAAAPLLWQWSCIGWLWSGSTAFGSWQTEVTPGY
eukprot:scaffold10747_cov21-Phaeocystis_antarctica.AAC.1